MGTAPGPLQRPPPCLQVHRRPQPVPGRSDPVRPCHGGTGYTADLRQVAPGQGPGRTYRSHLPGPARNRTQNVRAATIDEANEVLGSFLPRFNERFSVQAEEATPAYRPLDPALPLDHVLCFKNSRKVARDNTVKYNKRTLQLLPGGDLPSYAGLQVEVHEDLEGCISVQYLGQTIATQEAPPRPGLLRAAAAARAQGNGESQWGIAVNGRWQKSLAILETGDVDRPRRTRKSRAKRDRKPTPRQMTIWQAVQEAKLRGLSFRAIARELGIHWNTAKRYALADSPPIRRTTTPAQAQQPGCELAD